MADYVPTPEDDVFWLQRAGTILTGSIEQLDAGARRLADAMAWFWTVYSAVVLVVVVGTDAAISGGAVAALVVPVVLVFAAYLVATLATLPIAVGFDDRVPSEIKANHERVVRHRSCLVKVSAILAAAAAVSVAIAVVVVAVSQPQPAEDVALIGLSEEQTHVRAQGQLSEVEQVTVQLVGPNGLTSERVTPVVGGLFYTAIAVVEPGVYEVSVSWTVDERRFAVVEEVDKL